MFLSKAGMTVVEVASGEGQHGAMTGVHVAGDGSTVASDGGSILLAVEPTKPELVQLPDVGVMASVPPGGVTLEAEQVRQALKNLPGKGSGTGAMYAAVVEAVGGKIGLVTLDRKYQHQVAALPVPGRFLDWRGMIKAARGRATVTRVAVNRKKLMQLLKVIDSACPDSDNAVFIELGGAEDPVVLRAPGYATQQNVVGVLQPLSTQGRWLEDTDWEARLRRGADGVAALGGGARGRKVGG